ncbi:MAG: helix-turn-helix domain-containing protein [Deltaproteobacteria bacterium]|nr:helix-turn-helix domain-containing protein [Deltaproteobacteria bacterium]MBN2673049.1 helix-turn-helix domain-containing protein [Deltaproteobacteria bacterium]
MTQQQAEAANFDWRERLKNAYAIHNAIILRPELPVYLIEWNPEKDTREGEKALVWMDLAQPNNLMLRPQHFESYFGKDHVRDSHYAEALSEADLTNNVVIKELFGTYDLFHPLPEEPGRPRAYLYAGQFLLKPPNWETISRAWRAMTGQEAASANRDFVHYVRMLLELPVFEPPLLEAVKSFFAQYARYLTSGYDDTDIRREIDNINSDVFAKYWPIRDWVDSIITPNKFLPPPWHFVGKLTDWMKVGIGIDSLPTTAMTLMPLDSQKALLDPVKTLLRNAEIQRECIRFARNMDDTAATALQDYGVSIVTSCKRGKSKARSRLELRERAQKFRDFVVERFGVNAVVGIGRSLTPGAPLNESHQEAVMAVHMCVQLEKDILFHDEYGDEEKFKYAQLQQSADELLEALNREGSTTLKLAADRYVQFVLRYANQRIEVIRGQFLATLFQMFNTVQRRNPMRQDARNSFINDLTVRVEETRSIEQLIDSFNDSVQRLSFVSTKAWRGPSVMLLEATLQYLKDNYFEPLPLPEVARKAGFSVPVFTRVFKQATGTSYLNYLRNIRIERAKKLLSTTLLTLEQIAQACGFNSQHHLIRAFKKVTNLTPGAYRKNHSNLLME